MESKSESHFYVSSLPGGEFSYELSNSIQGQKGGTRQDVRDMSRMGKQQELRRNFRFISIVGFVMILQSTWESILLAAQYGLTNGGMAGVIWVTVGVLVGALCMIASIAEMASMAPTAGGQYHWVSEFAPKCMEKPLSYLVGTMDQCIRLGDGLSFGCSAYINSNPGTNSAKKPRCQCCCPVADDSVDHVFPYSSHSLQYFSWQTASVGEGIFLVVHIFGFFTFLIVLWVMSDHAPASQVFGQFEDYGGWGNLGLSSLVGITTPLWCFLGPDAGAHISEELQDASLVLPSAMMWASFFNAFLGLVMLITFCFCLGPDWQDNVLGLGDTPTQTGIPIIQVLYTSTNSIPGTMIMTTILIILSMVGTITVIASSSRQVWAFARDKGFPFSSYIEHVRPGWDIPVNALLVILIVSLLISALNFGSYVALNAIISLSNAALLFSYALAIGCVRLKRWRKEPLLPRRWSLGRWGAIINDVALAFLVISFVFSFFPGSPNPAPVDMNWAVVIFAFVLVAASGYYFVVGRHMYVAPMSLVKRE